MRKAVSTLTVLSMLVPGVAVAGFNATVNKVDDFSEGVERIVVVTSECEVSLDCSRVEKKVRAELRKMASGFKVVPEERVREFLFGEGHLSYDTALRSTLSEEFELDALLEVQVPYATKGDGFGGKEASEAKVEVFLVRPGGAILMHGVGTGRPKNVVTSPERVAGNVVEKIFKEAFGD